MKFARCSRFRGASVLRDCHMGTVNNLSRAEIGQSSEFQARLKRLLYLSIDVHYAMYAVALGVSVAVWFIAIRAPLWLDETVSFYTISAGFSHIPSREGGLSSPPYFYILWFATKILGTSEIALRVPEILAMLAAAYLLYRAARELFHKDAALITTVLFCIHPIIIFSSIDVRPYAFAVLAENAAIFVLFRLRKDDSNRLAAVLGILAAAILYFRVLFVVLMPALAICFLVFKVNNRKTLWRQAGVAAGAFTVAFLPLVTILAYMFRTGKSHSFADTPGLRDIVWTIAPGLLAVIMAAVYLGAAATRQLKKQSLERWSLVCCASLALVPLLILFLVSTATPLHIFVERYRLVAIPGIALFWGLIIDRVASRQLRVLFCVAVLAVTAFQYWTSPSSTQHGYTWKYALQFAEANASVDRAPVLICSDFREADYERMPVDSAKDSILFTQLSYYKLSVPVVPLPRALNDETARVTSDFLRDPSHRHGRFLALAFLPSFPTLDWLSNTTSATHYSRNLGVYDGVTVMEFVPRSQENAPR